MKSINYMLFILCTIFSISAFANNKYDLKFLENDFYKNDREEFNYYFSKEHLIKSIRKSTSMMATERLKTLRSLNVKSMNEVKKKHGLNMIVWPKESWLMDKYLREVDLQKRK